MTDKQYFFVVKILEREGLFFMAEDIAFEHSNGTTRNLRALNYKQTQSLIETFLQPSAKQKMKRKILSMAHEMRWELPNGKVNLEKLDMWCKKYTPSHVPFNEIDKKELPLVVSVFEKMYKSFLKQL